MQDLLLSYYGDDLTGSTDVMEALELGGVPTVLFMRQPDAALLSRFGHCRAIGLAGTSRSETPQWMDTHLRDAFAWLKTLNAEICHYKVCSTFDSSPTIGSIGRAIEIGRSVFAQASVPLLVGAPQLKRYTTFGHLFAAYRDQYFRIDRHPVMSRHPTTPMDESDLLIHL
ncbi:four-carbon acid sugar kinase family protein, partial [Mesorhizobium sp. M7A.F.Ca.ET.027.03.2.1]